MGLRRPDPLLERIADMRRYPQVSVPQITRKFGPAANRLRRAASDGAATHGPTSGGPATRQTLLTADGVRLTAFHLPGPDREWAFVVCHGFTGSGTSPDIRRVVSGLRPFGGVITFDFRGHGRSRGRSTVGDLEVFDLHAAIEWARVLGYRNVATVGFSMGASVVVRHGALSAVGGRGHSSTTDAVVSVSGPGWWFERSTTPMKWIHWLVEHPVGRLVSSVKFKTRILASGWDPVPESPMEMAGRIAPVPLLVVHGDADKFFPVAHAHALYDAAEEPRQLWIERGFGHAEASAGIDLVTRIGKWVVGLDGDGADGLSGLEGSAAS
jgi:pimeloyl-ACP methyl ester carboxylesterase